MPRALKMFWCSVRRAFKFAPLSIARFTHMLRPRHTLSFTVLGMALVGCSADHAVTGPRQQSPTRPSFQTITPPSGSRTLAPTSNQDAIPTTVVVSYPGPTLVQVHASGTVSLWAQPGNIYKGDMGAGGVHSPNSGSCTGNVYISNGANFIGFCTPGDNPQPPRDPWDTTYVVTGDVNVGWVQGPMSGGTETFTGGPFVVTITPVTVDYNVTANPTTLNYNDTVTVTASVTPSQVNGLNVPWSIDSTTWAPAFGTQGSPCAYGNWVVVDAGTQTCRKPFTRSGTLTVFATVDGTKQQNAFSITVTPPTLKATASPSTIQGPQHVTFTATATPSTISWNLSGQGWYWMPDHPPDNNYSGNCSWNNKTCTATVGRSGWMKATATIGEYFLADSVHVDVTPPQFKVTASPKSITSGQSVTFTATVTPAPAVAWNLSGPWTWRPDVGTGGISADCQWFENPCTRTISKSGWMKATTTIGEYTLTDSVRVYVIPCPTGDSLVDRESARNLLSTLWSQANPTAPPANRIERGGYIYDSLGVDITVVSQQDPSDNPCSNLNPKTRTLPVVVGIHEHPFSTGDSLPWQQCNFQPLQQGYYVMGHTWGGPSAGDWVRSYRDQGPHIVMDADSIYRYGPPDSLHAQLSPSTGDTISVPAGNWQAKIGSYPRNSGSCTRP